MISIDFVQRLRKMDSWSLIDFVDENARCLFMVLQEEVV
jgi:hypothetical protein